MEERKEGSDVKTPEPSGGDGPFEAGADSRSEAHPADGADDNRDPADAAAGPTEPQDMPESVVEAFERELADANRRADENWDRYLRAEADLDNHKRAAERRRGEATLFERRRLLGAFLSVADNLERALSHSGGDPEALLAGVEATLRALRQLLDGEGVSTFDALESEFDPSMHEAVGVVMVPGLEGEKVVAVELPGYTLGGELLRPARVVVGRAADQD